MRWYAAKSWGNSQSIITDEETGRTVAVTYDRADAPLIAAAPELLDACRRALSIFDAEREATDFYSATRRLIENAVNAATEV